MNHLDEMAGADGTNVQIAIGRRQGLKNGFQVIDNFFLAADHQAGAARSCWRPFGQDRLFRVPLGFLLPWRIHDRRKASASIFRPWSLSLPMSILSTRRRLCFSAVKSPNACALIKASKV